MFSAHVMKHSIEMLVTACNSLIIVGFAVETMADVRPEIDLWTAKDEEQQAKVKSNDFLFFLCFVPH